MSEKIIPYIVVSMPSQQFMLSRKFQPASNGKIYIGNVDTDPKEPNNQIQVYIENEDGSLVAAPQPININAAGYPVYNGQIAKFVTDKPYSMLVLDSYGVQQFYFPNIIKYNPDQFEVRIRGELASNNGAAMIGTAFGETVQQKFDNLPSELDVAGTAAELINKHNHDNKAHPELSEFISSEAKKAEAASDAAQLSAGIYSTIDKGLEETSIGEYFTYPSSDYFSFLNLYFHDADNTAKFIKSYPATDAIFRFRGAIPKNASILVPAVGVHYLDANASYTDTPANFVASRTHVLYVHQTDNIGRFFTLTLQERNNTNRIWTRIFDVNNTQAGVWKFGFEIDQGSVNNANIVDKAVARRKLSDTYAYNSAITASDDCNTLTAEGRHVVTGAAKNLPDGFKSGYLDVANYNNSSFVVQTATDLTDMKAVWKRVIRVQNGLFGEWVFINSSSSSSSLLANKKVVFFGDSITEFGTYPEQVGMLTGANVINVGIGGTRMSKHNATSQGRLYEKFSMFNIARYINTSDFSEAIAAADELHRLGVKDYRAIVERMSKIDFTTVDYIVIGYGTNDFSGDIEIGGNADIDSTGSTFKGSMNYAIQQILTKYPNISLCFNGPIWRSRINAGDGKDSDFNTNTIGKYLIDYQNAIIELADLNHVNSIDSYRKSGFNKYREQKMIVDGVHPTDFGYQSLAMFVATRIS